MVAVLIWWLVLQVIGILALPVALKLLRFLPDRGFGFARPVGLLLTGYLFWLLVTLGLLQNTTPSIVLVLLLVGGLSAYLWKREGREMLAFLRGETRMIIATELVFLVALAGFSFFRAYNPEIAWTEKPMEFGFINAILRSRTFPPNDQWLSGYAISYYYFGYVIAAMLTRLSGLPSDITFNLTLVTLFALTASGAFSLVYNLVRAYLQRSGQETEQEHRLARWVAPWAGLVGATLVALMGNLEGVFELIRARGGGSEALWRWLDVKNLQASVQSATWYPDDTWWWWRASRVIHDRDALGNSMEVIDEFPFFSFLLGDVHPHVLALPFVMLAIALALNLALSWRQRPAVEAAGEAEAADAEASADEPAEQKGGLWGAWQRFVGDLWSGGTFDLVLWGLFLGSLGFLNTWDYPIYLAIFVAAYAFRRQVDYRKPGWAWLGDVAQMGVLLLALGLVFYLPFYLGFRSQAGGIGLVGDIKTRWHQYLLMFGVFIVFTAGLLVALWLRYSRGASGARRLSPASQVAAIVTVAVLGLAVAQGWWTTALIALLAGGAGVLLLSAARFTGEGAEAQPAMSTSALFALLLMVAGLLLTGSVEFIFLKDTFNTRMNTVFKFYYQGWVLLGLAAAYGLFYVAHSLRRAKGIGRVGLAAWGVAAVLLVGGGLSYTAAAAVSKANGFRGEPTLDGTRHVAPSRQSDYEAIQWLRQNATPGAVLLEAPGGSYTEYNWVSAHTGIPTVLGWGGHELQWRGNYDEPGRREPDITAIYQGMDPARVRELLDKYDVDYVYVGQLERNKYHLSQPMIAKFDRVLQRVYDDGGVIIFGRDF